MNTAAPQRRDASRGEKKTRVGILGGSFNPAHSGHLHITALALDLLHLDEAWWLVAPQNPLKSADELAPFPDRVAAARSLANGVPRIVVTDLEQEMGTRSTVATVEALQLREPAAGFVWIMGADNLAELHRWKNWTRLLELVPVAVFDRPSYSFLALKGIAARRFADARRTRREAGLLAGATPPAWVFLWTAFDPASATAMRGDREGNEGANGHPR